MCKKTAETLLKLHFYKKKQTNSLFQDESRNKIVFKRKYIFCAKVFRIISNFSLRSKRSHTVKTPPYTGHNIVRICRMLYLSCYFRSTEILVAINKGYAKRISLVKKRIYGLRKDFFYLYIDVQYSLKFAAKVVPTPLFQPFSS